MRLLLLAALLPASLALADDLTREQRKKMEEDARELNRQAIQLTNSGRAADAIPLFEQVTATFRRLYPDETNRNGREYLAANLYNLGTVQYRAGNLPKAIEHLDEALAIRRKLYPKDKYPNGDQVLLGNLNALGFIYERSGQFKKALAHHEEVLAMASALYKDHKDGHYEIAMALSHIGSIYGEMGDLAKGREHLERALAMLRRVVPKDHYDGQHQIADALTDLAMLLRQAREYDGALARLEERLDVIRAILPKAQQEAGHPDVAMALAQIGETHALKGDVAKARPPLDEAMKTFAAIYPKDKYPAGHPNLASCTAIYGRMLHRGGDWSGAQDHFARAVAISRALYPRDRFPDGHAYLAVRLVEMGQSLHTLGKPSEALAAFEEAIDIRRKQAERELPAAPEPDALLLATKRAALVDLYLSSALAVHGTDARAYGVVWDAKAAVMRVLQRRQQAARIALADAKGDRAVREKWSEFQQASRAISALLANPGADVHERDAELRGLTDRKERIERELAAIIPEIRPASDSTPTALSKALPVNTVFVDLYRYLPISGDKAGPAYAAFVLTRDKEPIRVELEDAGAIDAAVAAWLRSINRRESGPEGMQLSKHVWAPIGRHVLEGTTTIYVAADGDLARIPWAALPTPSGVLLEGHAIAVVPHGPFLLDALRAKPTIGPEKPRGLVVGGADYGGSGAYPYLPGTAAEAEVVSALAGDRAVSLSGREATSARVLENLARSRFAHLATHGYFAEKDLSEERRRAAEFVREGAARTDRQVGLGQRSPLSFVGLVFAGANRDGAASIATGEVLVTLPLDGLQLCVLSACETGLGQYTGGEGVQGLQRAFHLAGCPNVVASLWKVNDEATAAMMRRFYHHLWEKNESPIQALRLAQLELYRNPTQVAELVRGGAPKFSGITKPLPKGEAPKQGERAATKLWAAFVLSGVGR